MNANEMQKGLIVNESVAIYYSYTTVIVQP